MNKKVMAVAVAGALAVPSAVALAQTSTVQIGGSITAFYYQHKPNHDAIGKKSDIMETSEPELFIRGEENLGGGLSAWFMCSSSFPVIDGTAAANTAGFCGRNSGIGFKGSWGNAFFGNWDTPQKLLDNAARGWWGGTNSLTGGAMTLLAGGTASGLGNNSGVAGSGQNTFFRRQANSLSYHSPSWNGFSFQGMFSAGNETVTLPATTLLTPRMYSLAAQYSTGPIYVGLGYEAHNDYNPASIAVLGGAVGQYSGGTDTRWTIVGGYTFAGVVNLRGQYAKMEYDVSNGQSLDVDGWGLFVDWNIGGPHTLRAQYVDMGDVGGNATASVGSYAAPVTLAGAARGSTGGKQWGVAYSYAFSKRTMGSVAYTKMENDTNARFSKGKVVATLGGDQSSMGLILQHRF